jgi:hypothetical protein
MKAEQKDGLTTVNAETLNAKNKINGYSNKDDNGTTFLKARNENLKYEIKEYRLKLMLTERDYERYVEPTLKYYARFRGCWLDLLIKRRLNDH